MTRSSLFFLAGIALSLPILIMNNPTAQMGEKVFYFILAASAASYVVAFKLWIFNKE